MSFDDAIDKIVASRDIQQGHSNSNELVITQESYNYSDSYTPYSPRSYQSNTPTLPVEYTSNQYQPAENSFHKVNSVLPHLTPFNALQHIEENNNRLRVLREANKNRSKIEFLDFIRHKKYSLNFEKYIPPRTQGQIILPDILLERTTELSSNNQFPAEFISISMLAGVSGSFHRRLMVSHFDGKAVESGNIFFLAEAPSGMRKSGIIGCLRKPYKDFEESKNLDIEDRIIMCENNKEAVKKYKLQTHKLIAKMMREAEYSLDFEGILSEVEETSHIIKRKAMPKQVATKLLVDDVAPNQLTQILCEQGESSVCISAEHTFPNKFLLSRMADPAFFNHFYNQEPYEKIIRGKRYSLSHPAFTFLGFAQQTIIEKLYKDRELTDLGTMARFLPYCHSMPHNFYCHTNTFLLPNQVNNATHELNKRSSNERAYDIITRCLQLYHTQEQESVRYILKLTSTAYNLIDRFEKYLLERLLPVFPERSHAALRKLHGQALRLAMGIHACYHDVPHKESIDENELIIAIYLCEWLLPHINFVYSSHGLHAISNVKRIVASIQDVTNVTGQDTLSNGYIKSYVLKQRTSIKLPEIHDAIRFLSLYNLALSVDTGRSSNCIVVSDRLVNYKFG